MDVQYINPFLAGTLEVLKKMAHIDAVPGTPRVKADGAACGDVSGIIGITGDALGSLALSFSEACICEIVANMLGERFDGVTQEIIDAAGELTNMISGASRTRMEKMGMSVYAAIPTVVHGRQHTISHILKSPSIVIPFSTAPGPSASGRWMQASAPPSTTAWPISGRPWGPGQPLRRRAGPGRRVPGRPRPTPPRVPCSTSGPWSKGGRAGPWISNG